MPALLFTHTAEKLWRITGSILVCLLVVLFTLWNYWTIGSWAIKTYDIVIVGGAHFQPITMETRAACTFDSVRFVYAAPN